VLPTSAGAPQRRRNPAKRASRGSIEGERNEVRLGLLKVSEPPRELLLVAGDERADAELGHSSGSSGKNHRPET
jgi:hypothetical protein